MIGLSSRALRPLAVALGIALVGGGACSDPAFAQGQPAPVAPAAPAQPAIGDPGAEATVQTSRAYRIRQGDELTVTVFGETSLTPLGPLRVVQGGTIAMPLVGEVAVGGMTPAGASVVLERALRKYVRQPQVTVAVFSVGPVEALVLGNVRFPGKYTLPPPARLTDVLAASGGLGPTDGDFPTVRLELPDGTTSSVSLQSLLHDGNESLNVVVESGETVYVPAQATFTIEVLGAVERGGDVLMHEGDDVATAIARAGTDAEKSPDLNHVTVKHLGQEVQTINLYPILEKGDLSHDIKVQKGDTVFVPTAPKRTGFGDIFFALARFLPY
jgi:polysaccharide export outer membrane protein